MGRQAELVGMLLLGSFEVSATGSLDTLVGRGIEPAPAAVLQDPERFLAPVPKAEASYHWSGWDLDQMLSPPSEQLGDYRP